MFGLLNINKMAGLTSRQVVNRVQRLVRPAKVGHAGTLDPMATGVLIVCVGPATKLISLVQQQSKVYRSEFVFGQTSNTDDSTGYVLDVLDPEPVTRQQLDESLHRFRGEISQTPPQFSAVKVNGQRAYKLARQGQSVEIRAKTVRIDRLETIHFEYPRLQLEIECGSGTYIRSIARDLGRLLGCGAVMSQLERTRIGDCAIDDALNLDDLTPETLSNALLPPTLATRELPCLNASQSQCERLRNGQWLSLDPQTDWTEDRPIAVLSPDGQLVCLASYRERDRSLAPKQVFPAVS
ncbi:tRNA pseudouridine(55) synthase TruB [Thalassoroseus pseudoceratinae]|uniref:tRNA pseudouridine(55) synthase TruB n=1 Tax=Thalassoroseus pseudoceratinae TaxID=2713176 RepID=UPI001422A979|nr:tRNA pseudouridine(55) synthase TruB [Thalassoroseus pseudoceratinae]